MNPQTMNSPTTLLAAGGRPWPAETAAAYRRDGYWTGERLDRIAEAAIRATPDHPAVVDDHGQLSYAELGARISRLAAVFSHRGLTDRDRVILQLPNRIELVVSALALMRIGAIPVYCLGSSRERELRAVADRAKAVAVLVGDGTADYDAARVAADVAEQVESARWVMTAEQLRSASITGTDIDQTYRVSGTNDIAFLQLSGGTTGLPKLIPRTHDDYLYSIRQSNVVCGLAPQDVFLSVIPAVHNFPMSSPGFLGVLLAGGTVVLTEDQFPGAVFDLVARHRVTVVPLVPPLAHLWVNHAELEPAAIGQLSSLRLLQVGGAKLVPQLARRLLELVPGALQQVFGMAEGLVCYTRPDDDADTVIGTQGRPMSDADEIRIVDEQDRPVASGHRGHLLTRGPYTIRGYFRAPEANRQAFTEDGFYRTGDIVRQRADGSIIVEGRSKDQINRGGEKISAEEVEDILLAHPAIDDVVLVAEPDEYLGERSVAIIVPARAGTSANSGVDRKSIAAYLRGCGVDVMKVPDRIETTEQFPVTGVGKISRVRLRTLLREQRSTNA